MLVSHKAPDAVAPKRFFGLWFGPWFGGLNGSRCWWLASWWLVACAVCALCIMAHGALLPLLHDGFLPLVLVDCLLFMAMALNLA